MNRVLLKDVVTIKTAKVAKGRLEVPLRAVELEHIKSNTGSIDEKVVAVTSVGSTKNRFRKGDVLYGKLRPYLNKYALPNFDGVCSTEIWVLHPNTSVLIPSFLFYLIQTASFADLANKSSGSKMPRADWNVVSNYTFNLPALEEQQKIASFFTLLDERISFQKEKIALLKKQKQGYMQRIFSQELRFKNDDGSSFPNWKNQYLSELFSKQVKIIRIKDNETYSQVTISKTGKVFLRGTTLGKTIGRKRQFQIDLKDNSASTFFTFIRQGVFDGAIGRIPNSLDGAIVTENMPILKLNSTYSPEFIAQWLQSERYHHDVIFPAKPTGSAQLALHEKIWLAQKSLFPEYQEQVKIAYFLDSLDQRITLERDHLALLQEQKKAYLQKVFD